MMALASDILAQWATAGPADRQAILRHLVEGVEIEAAEDSEATRLTIRWVGGVSADTSWSAPSARTNGWANSRGSWSEFVN